MHAASLLHDFADPRLALLEGPCCLILAGKLFHAKPYAALSEIYLGHGILSFWVLRRVDLAQDLQVGQAICFFLREV